MKIQQKTNDFQEENLAFDYLFIEQSKYAIIFLAYFEEILYIPKTRKHKIENLHWVAPLTGKEITALGIRYFNYMW